MSESPMPYIGQIKLASFDYAPKGWAICDGSLLPVEKFAELHSVIGSLYGGDGKRTFALPDLRGRAPMHFGSHKQGTSGGTETVTLTVDQIPPHTHQPVGTTTTGSLPVPTGNVWAVSRGLPYNNTADAPMSPSALATSGEGGPHENMQPSTVLTFIIALTGTLPPR
ncbi:hypothetical protein BWI17_13075 [Betaproteobacteria bacterium GR16-43]|nr:hypothetical protein BWI17_13075 [Betaproteobacteria bacterium GR16-43]